MISTVTIGQVPPREQDGRDAFSRYRAQVRSAAIAALAILESKGIERVYCDFHDDYVVQKNENGIVRYRFVQVKTKAKQNENWTLGELLGIDSRKKDLSKEKAEKIRDSFVGKLLLHTVVFADSCEQVVFETNTNLDTKASAFYDDLRKAVFSDKYVQLLRAKFNECYEDKLLGQLPETKIDDALRKIVFEPDVTHIKLKNVEIDNTVRQKIFDYSEIDLTRIELDQILLKRLDLVAGKSSGVIKEITDETIKSCASIGIEDLLNVMAISKVAYELLKSGQDKNAIKSASLIQRTLGEAAKDSDTIEYCSKCKIEWDEWYRKRRRDLSPLDIAEITDEIVAIIYESLDWKRCVKLSRLKSPLQSLLTKLKSKLLFLDLTEDILLGAFFSELIKMQA